jgi:perosamine synthetase
MITEHSQLAFLDGTPAIPAASYTPWPAPEEKHLEALSRVIKSGKFHRVNHPIVQQWEESLIQWTNFRHVRATSSGSAAIHTLVDYFSEGRSSIILSALNWPGAAFAAHHCGLRPIFVDISLETGGMDDLALCEAVSQASNPVVLITHLFGNAIMVPKARALCQKRSIPVIDDAAQAASMARFLGNNDIFYSSAVALSGNGAKHFGAGELGAYCCNDVGIAEHIDKVSLSSSSRNGERIFSPLTKGFNYRPNVFSASIALSRMDSIDSQIRTRQSNVAELWSSINMLPGLKPLCNLSDSNSIYCSFPLQLDTSIWAFDNREHARNVIVDALKAEGLPASVWLTKPVWEYHPEWKNAWSLKDFPNTECILRSMFHITEIAPPNDSTTMALYAEAIKKVWIGMPDIVEWYRNLKTS